LQSDVPAGRRGSENALSWRYCLAALVGYGTIAVVFFWPLLVHFGTHLYSQDQFNWPGKGGDEFSFLWMYWWVDKAIAEGRHILFCDWVFPPTGANLALRSIPFLPILVTYPIGRIFGPVVGNNVMVLLMVIGGAWAYFIFCVRGLSVRPLAAFIAGVLFGFSPYFVWKAGIQYNLMGSCFWGPVLGITFYVYSHDRFTLRNGLLFAAFLWATFWTSLVEFFMLGVVLATMVLLWEIAYAIRGNFRWHTRAGFYAPSLIGLASLVLLHYAPANQSLTVPLIEGVSFKDLIPAAKLSIFSYLGLPNRTEIVVPHSMAWLALFGLVALWRKRCRYLLPLGVLLAVTLSFPVDLFGLPHMIVRALPLGTGFRNMGRFFPFFLFFLGIPAAFGVEFLLDRRNEAAVARTGPLLRIKWKWTVLAVLLVFGALEYYPYLLKVTPVRTLPLDRQTREALDRNSFLLVVPGGWNQTAYDSYQMGLDMPSVYIRTWDHMSYKAARERAERFPAVYDGYRHQMSDPYEPNVKAPDFFQELRTLHVKYVLLVDGASSKPFEGKGRVLVKTNHELLMELKN